jgi:hypothetical protein
MVVRFGFLLEPAAVRWSCGVVEPMPDHDRRTRPILESERHYAGWFYPPLAPVPRDGAGPKQPPLMPTTFSLPATHVLELSDELRSERAEDFFIALFGLLHGLRLQRESWQHFYRCPTRRGALCDFYADRGEVNRTLDIASDFWRRHANDDVRNLAFGAIHWHLFAQLYEHAFERFSAQYIAFDACWALARRTVAGLGKVEGGHPERPRALCRELGLSEPKWLSVDAHPEERLSVRRNALMHEAFYGGEPLGFAHPTAEPGMELELTGFVARCLLGLLGVRNEYTGSPVTTRQVIGFTFDRPIQRGVHGH